jgi:hypothetical protein
VRLGSGEEAGRTPPMHLVDSQDTRVPDRRQVLNGGRPGRTRYQHELLVKPVKSFPRQANQPLTPT